MSLMADGSHSLSTQNHCTLSERPLQPAQHHKSVCLCVINEQEHPQSLLHTRTRAHTHTA